MAYNGWSNYETWRLYTWLTNDQATHNTCRALAEECGEFASRSQQVQRCISTMRQATKFMLADRLKKLVQDGNPLTEDPSLYSDLLDASISDVDWHELAGAFLADD